MATNSALPRAARPDYVKSLTTVKDSDPYFVTFYKLIGLCKVCIALFFDIVTHIYGFASGQADFLEGGMTIGLHLISCFLCFFVAKYSSTTHPLWNSFLLLLGLYDVEWKLHKWSNDRSNRKLVNDYLTDATPKNRPRPSGDWPDNSERIAGVNLHANNIVDVNLEFINTMICALPMAGLKIYFGFMAEFDLERSCSLATISRLPFILFGLVGIIKMTVQYDIISLRYLSAHNWKYFMDTDFTSTLDVAEFNIFSKLSIFCFHAVFIIYRVRMIVFNFTLGVIFGLLHLIFLVAMSIILHITSRPFYENPPVGVPTITSDFIEIWTKVFTLRDTHLKKEWVHWDIRFEGRVEKYRLLYFFTIWISHFVGIIFHIIYNEFVASRVIHENVHRLHNSTCSKRVYEFASVQLEKLHLEEYPTYSEFSFDFFCNNIQFYLFICLNVIFVIHFTVLHFTKLTHSEYPAHTAINIWSRIFMNRGNGKYLSDPQLPWLKKFLVLSTLGPSDFKELTKKKKEIDWDALFEKESRNVPVNTNAANVNDFLNAQNPEQNPAKQQLLELLHFAVRNGNSAQNTSSLDSAHLTELTFNFCLNFTNRMEHMTSLRIRDTCKMLGLSPVVPPPTD